MNESVVISYTNQALMLVLIISMPPILVATFIGLIISLLQALTQIQEQTLAFAVKLVCITGVLALMSHWIGQELIRYATYIFDRFPVLVK